MISTHDHFLRGMQPDRGRKIALMVALIVALTLIFAAVMQAFYGKKYLRDADMLTQPVTSQASPEKAPAPSRPPLQTSPLTPLLIH